MREPGTNGPRTSLSLLAVFVGGCSLLGSKSGLEDTDLEVDIPASSGSPSDGGGSGTTGDWGTTDDGTTDGWATTDWGTTEPPVDYEYVDFAWGTLDLTYGVTAEEACMQANGIESFDVAPGCPDCVFAFWFDVWADPDRTTCAELSSMDGANVGLGVFRDYYGIGPMVTYYSYGAWCPIFYATYTGGYAYFYHDRSDDYYETLFWSGSILAY